MRMPTGRNQKGIFSIVTRIKSVEVTQSEEIGNVTATPSEGTESVHSVPPYNTRSHQPLYSKKILMQKVSKNWKGFNSQIKAWQSQKGYKKLNNRVIARDQRET